MGYNDNVLSRFLAHESQPWTPQEDCLLSIENQPSNDKTTSDTLRNQASRSYFRREDQFIGLTRVDNMAVRSTARHVSFFQRLHTVAI